MTEAQRVKLEEYLDDFEVAVTVRTLCDHPNALEVAVKATDDHRERILDHLSTIQRFSKAQTMLIKVYADELNSDSEDILYHYQRALEKRDLLDSTTQTQIEPVKRNGAR